MAIRHTPQEFLYKELSAVPGLKVYQVRPTISDGDVVFPFIQFQMTGGPAFQSDLQDLSPNALTFTCTIVGFEYLNNADMFAAVEAALCKHSRIIEFSVGEEDADDEMQEGKTAYTLRINLTVER